MNPLIAISLLLLSIQTTVFCRTVVYHLDVSYKNVAPDNYYQKGIVVNGQFPAPEIRCNPNDTLVVYVRNCLDHEFSMHWHGMRQLGSVESDGALYVTQQGIPPNATFRYSINIGSQHGTYLYHAHSKLDSIWVYGPLIINDKQMIKYYPEYCYDFERTLIVAQLWHTDVDIFYDGIVAPNNFTGIPAAKSVVINGRSYGVWNDSQEHDLPKGYPVINVEPNRIYRFRFIGFAENTIMSCKIEGHNMTLIEVDGFFVQPLEVEEVRVNIAQRSSVLLNTYNEIDNYIIKCNQLSGPGPDNGVAILHYKGSPDPSPGLTEVNRPNQTQRIPLDRWIYDDLRIPDDPKINGPAQYEVPHESDEQILIVSHLTTDSAGRSRFSINDEFWVNPELNYLAQARRGIDISQAPSIYNITLPDVVDIAFQNTMFAPGVCVQHPFHIHGHHFYIVAEGADKYEDNEQTRQLIKDNIDSGHLRFRDVFTLFPNFTKPANETQAEDPCGWTVVRFISDDPGVWFVHCHITMHFIMGKSFALWEIGGKQPKPDPQCPSADFTCPSEDGYFLGPKPDQYWQCGAGYCAYLRDCPQGTCWDEESQVCSNSAKCYEIENQIVKNYDELYGKPNCQNDS